MFESDVCRARLIPLTVSMLITLIIRDTDRARTRRLYRVITQLVDGLEKIGRRNRIANSANLHTARCSLLSLPFESTASIKKLCSGLEKFVKVIEFAAINISKIRIVAVEVKF